MCSIGVLKIAENVAVGAPVGVAVGGVGVGVGAAVGAAVGAEVGATVGAPGLNVLAPARLGTLHRSSKTIQIQNERRFRRTAAISVPFPKPAEVLSGGYKRESQKFTSWDFQL